MKALKRIAPIFAVRDLDAAIAHYKRLGFSTRIYEGGGYVFASRERIEIDLGEVPAGDHRVGSGATALSTMQTDLRRNGSSSRRRGAFAGGHRVGPTRGGCR